MNAFRNIRPNYSRISSRAVFSRKDCVNECVKTLSYFQKDSTKSPLIVLSGNRGAGKSWILGEIHATLEIETLVMKLDADQISVTQFRQMLIRAVEENGIRNPLKKPIVLIDSLSQLKDKIEAESYQEFVHSLEKDLIGFGCPSLWSAKDYLSEPSKIFELRPLGFKESTEFLELQNHPELARYFFAISGGVIKHLASIRRILKDPTFRPSHMEMACPTENFVAVLLRNYSDPLFESKCTNVRKIDTLDLSEFEYLLVRASFIRAFPKIEPGSFLFPGSKTTWQDLEDSGLICILDDTFHVNILTFCSLVNRYGCFPTIKHLLNLFATSGVDHKVFERFWAFIEAIKLDCLYNAAKNSTISPEELKRCLTLQHFYEGGITLQNPKYFDHHFIISCTESFVTLTRDIKAFAAHTQDQKQYGNSSVLVGDLNFQEHCQLNTWYLTGDLNESVDSYRWCELEDPKTQKSKKVLIVYENKLSAVDSSTTVSYPSDVEKKIGNLKSVLERSNVPEEDVIYILGACRRLPKRPLSLKCAWGGDIYIFGHQNLCSDNFFGIFSHVFRTAFINKCPV